ncbi:MAG: LysR family transcriptional regulator substrate-binding protein, partial [Desulfovibrionaceae bacterium]|nr:LysR family transcriptional regulator substrate-binding protein [Desulfovibrionaceae bacterium]
RFRTWVMDNQSLERHLQENHLDFAIVLLPVTSAQYTFHNLRPKPYYAVYGRGMPAPLTPSVKLQDLGLPLVVQQRRDYAGGMKSLLLKIFQKNSNHPRIVLETQDTSFLRQLLREGFPAVGILNEYEVKGTGMESLPTARVDEESLSLTASIITLRDAYISVAAQKVIETVLEKF